MNNFYFRILSNFLGSLQLGISKSHTYKVIHKLNAELRDKGYLTISGRVNRNFFMEKFCYGKTGKEG